MSMKRTKKLALASILTALAIIFLFAGSVLQTLDLSASAIASIVVLISFIELGKKWASAVYVAASILSLVLLPYKTAALIFALFAGYYPILKEPLNRICPKWLSYLARIVCFNVFIVIAVFFFSNLLLTTETTLLKWMIYLVSNLTFVLYDFALERISVTYFRKIRPVFSMRR